MFVENNNNDWKGAVMAINRLVTMLSFLDSGFTPKLEDMQSVTAGPFFGCANPYCNRAYVP